MDTVELKSLEVIALADSARDPRLNKYSKLVAGGYLPQVLTMLHENWRSVNNSDLITASAIGNLISAVEFGRVAELPAGQMLQIFNTTLDNIFFQAKKL